MLQHVIMHFSLHFLSVVAHGRLKIKENIIFNDVTRNERHNNKAAREIILGNVNRLRFIQIPSKRLKKTQGHS